MGATASGGAGHEGQADHDRGPGHGHWHGGGEFEGVLGLLGGLTMAFGRGRRARLVAGLAEVGPGDRVVDVGCGPGRFLREAAERGATAVGVDPSAQMRRRGGGGAPAPPSGCRWRTGRPRSPGRSPPTTTGPTPTPAWPSCAASCGRAAGC